jgi:hypothetical protein
MYFAVQAMAAELATGALVMFQIQKKEKYRCCCQQQREFYKKKQLEELLFKVITFNRASYSGNYSHR